MAMGEIPASYCLTAPSGNCMFIMLLMFKSWTDANLTKYWVSPHSIHNNLQ
jgi:hypothetical protein